MSAPFVPVDFAAGVRDVEGAALESDFRVVEAVGIAIDDPSEPRAAVAVHGGQIVYLGISDTLLGLPLDELNDIINALIVTAFGNWRAQMRA